MRPLVALLGPTASGKTEIALAAARRAGAVVLSVDSVQVYRGMDIGTAKPTAEQRLAVPHLMIDVVDPDHDFTVAEFQTTARRELERLSAPILVVGGSGLHFRAVVDPLSFPPTDPTVRQELEGLEPGELVAELRSADPAVGDVIDLANPRRVIRAVEILRITGETPSHRASSTEAEAVREYRAHYPVIAFGVDAGVGLSERIERRVVEMRAQGLLDEVRKLAPHLGRLASQAVGYRELLDVVAGTEGEDVAFGMVVDATRRLAKRQRTFFRRDPRIRWVSADSAEDLLVAALKGSAS